MKPISPSSAAILSFLLAIGAAPASPAAQAPPAQAPAVLQPGAPGEATKEIPADKAADTSHLTASPADVRFMQGMIEHHAQAVEMVDLLKTRTNSQEMRLLAKRIELSQVDEIKMMQQWLKARGQEVPTAHDMAMHDGMPAVAMADMSSMSMHGTTMPPMPGMLTREEMQRLAAAKGTEFDRLFLQGMIKHHGGALTMVKELFATPGAGQDSEIFAFASDVDADQRMEIDRMTTMLKELPR